MLRLLLNALHALAYGIRPPEQVKGAFEVRTAVLSGYEPELAGCATCGQVDSDPFYLDVMNGALICRECFGNRQRSAAPADP